MSGRGEERVLLMLFHFETFYRKKVRQQILSL